MFLRENQKPIISVTNLYKNFNVLRRKKSFLGDISSFFLRKYEVKTALKDISFNINEGEFIGFIGPNGAGKSTTIKILSGILLPDSGTVKVMDKIPWKNRIEIVRNLGVVFGQRTQLLWDLPVLESFKALKAIYKIPDNIYKNGLDFLIEELRLSKLLNIPVRCLSLGQRMSCDIAASLLHFPKIIFLDEPTIGLDAINKLAIRDFIYRLNKERKVTIILMSHDMDDVESLCERVLILNEGSIVFDGPLKNIREKVSLERYLIIDLLNETDNIIMSNTSFVKKEKHRIWLRFNPNIITTSNLINKIASRYAIKDIYVENPSIEKIIAKFYQDINL